MTSGAAASSEGEDFVLPPPFAMYIIGTFFVAWSFLDGAMERTIWRLEGLSADAGKAKTEKMTSGALLGRLRSDCERLTGADKRRIEDQCDAVERLIEVRNRMAHSRILWQPSTELIVVQKTADLRSGGLVTVKTIAPAALMAAGTEAGRIALLLMQ